MRPSTPLLLRIFRARLVLGACILFVLMLALGFADPKESAFPLIAALGAFGLVALMRMHSRLTGWLFPVSDRQIAWLPMMALALIWLAGLAGLVLGETMASLLKPSPAFHFADYWNPHLRFFPATLLLLLILLRILRTSPGFIGFLGFLPFWLGFPGSSDFRATAVGQVLVGGWPVCVAGAVFLIWEAPAHWAALRRLNEIKVGWFDTDTTVRDLNGPIRVKKRTLMADALLGAIALALIVNWVALIAPQFSNLSEVVEKSGPFLFAYLFLIPSLLLPLGLAVSSYRHLRASSFGPMIAALFTLARLTIVLSPLAHALGAGRGALARCDFCAGYRFAWQARCPHCGEAGEGTPLSRAHQRRFERSWFVPFADPEAFLYRIIIPAQLIIISLMIHWWR